MRSRSTRRSPTATRAGRSSTPRPGDRDQRADPKRARRGLGRRLRRADRLGPALAARTARDRPRRLCVAGLDDRKPDAGARAPFGSACTAASSSTRRSRRPGREGGNSRRHAGATFQGQRSSSAETSILAVDGCRSRAPTISCGLLQIGCGPGRRRRFTSSAADAALVAVPARARRRVDRSPGSKQARAAVVAREESAGLAFPKNTGSRGQPARR